MMARLDVSDLLLDPDFIDPMIILHRRSSVNGFGENEVTEHSYAAVGSIQPTTGKDLERIPEAMRQKDVKTFWIKSEIKLTKRTDYPDILVHNGRRYQVISVQDWLNFGAGWNSGICVAEEPT